MKSILRMTDKTLGTCLVLCVAMLISGCLSVWLGKDLCWDVANYHYYNPDAWLHARDKIDFWPVSFLHQYINPTADLLPYFLIHFLPPLTAQFMLGAIHGINFWLLFLLARSFFSTTEYSPVLSYLLCTLITLTGLYGPTTLPGIGSLQQDIFVSLFVLGFVLLQIKRETWCAGLLLGIGIGLKLTAGSFAIGALCATLLYSSPIMRSLFLLSLGIALGLLLSAGHWMAMLWQQHHHPLFPFFNHLFSSPDFAAINWHDSRFMPKGLLQTLFYPFYFSWDGRIGEQPFQDFRFLIVYILLLITGLVTLYRRPDQRHEAFSWLLVFFICSYCAWQWYFSTARYLIPLEMLAPLVIALLIKKLIKQTLLTLSLIVVTLFHLLFFMTPMPMVRAPWYQTTYFNVKLPLAIQHIKTATVLMAYPAYALDTHPKPQSYLIPFFPPTWRFIGIPFLHQRYAADDQITRHIRHLLQATHGKIYLLTADVNMPALYHIAQQFDLVPDHWCEPIYSDRQMISHQQVLLCPVHQVILPV